MATMLIVHKPGMVPRIGYPVGGVADSLAEWRKSNPDAEIYVITAADLPAPGTAGVTLIGECLSMYAAMSECS